MLSVDKSLTVNLKVCVAVEEVSGHVPFSSTVSMAQDFEYLG